MGVGGGVEVGVGGGLLGVGVCRNEGHDTWPLDKISEVAQSARSCTYTLFLPKGSKLSLFSLYGQQFPRYMPIFKTAIFGHETWPFAKVPETAHILPTVPPESQISLRFALRLAISKIGYV